MITTPQSKDYLKNLSVSVHTPRSIPPTQPRVLRHCEERLQEMILLAIATNANDKQAVQTHTLSSLLLGATVEELDLVRKITSCQADFDSSNKAELESWRRNWRVLGKTPGSILKIHRELIALAVAVHNEKLEFADFHASSAMTLGVSVQQMESVFSTLSDT